jgi:hypothetical protein
MLQIQQQRIVAHLRSDRKEHTAEDIVTALRIDLRTNAALRQSLASHPRVKIVDQKRLMYRPQVEGVCNEQELLWHISTFPVPFVSRARYEDAYPAASADMDRLLREHRLRALYHEDTQECLLMLDDPARYTSDHTQLVSLYRSVASDMPSDDDGLCDALQHAGLPYVRRPKRWIATLAATGPPVKRRRATSYTNHHMGLEWLNTTMS